MPADATPALPLLASPVPPWDDADPYTMACALCDDDGIVRRGVMHHGKDYVCTGHAHFAGQHIRCVSPGHPGELPPDLFAALRAGSIPGPMVAVFDRDGWRADA